ncbi:MAG: hypothetical protein AAGF53_12865 [Pseudomonadota bacterium]
MVDPDKDMLVEVPNRVSFDINEHLTTGSLMTLVRTVQGMGSILDQRLSGTEWRKLVYKTIFEDTTRHTQEGTGSDIEAEFLKGNELLAHILGVKNT